MIEGLVLLLVFQLLGNVAEMYFHLPVPGSVLGMFLLLVALIANDRLASWVRPISLVLISYLAVLFVPAGVSPSEYRQSDTYQHASTHQQEQGGSLSLVADSLQYAYMKAQVEYIILPFKKRLDGFTYWQRELEPAIHPALKAYVKAENATGGVSSGMIFWEIARNTDHFCSDFKTDRDVRRFLTLYFWKCVCSFSNIGFHTGQDKTLLILKGEAD